MKPLLASTVVAVLLLVSAGAARADVYAFTFTDDAVGCASMTCLPVVAGGMFTTLPLPTDQSYFGPTIGSLKGMFNGFAMSLVSTGTQVIPDGQAGPGTVLMENALVFSAGGETYSLFWDDGPHPDGMRFDLRGDTSQTAAAVDWRAVSVADAGAISMALAALALMLVAIALKKNHASVCFGRR